MAATVPTKEPTEIFLGDSLAWTKTLSDYPATTWTLAYRLLAQQSAAAQTLTASASGSEWRTPPLWSIGLTAGVSGGEAYLHDGRARSLEEAILWHSGEAEAAKEAFRTMPAADRAALIKFLKSL